MSLRFDSRIFEFYVLDSILPILSYIRHGCLRFQVFGLNFEGIWYHGSRIELIPLFLLCFRICSPFSCLFSLFYVKVVLRIGLKEISAEVHRQGSWTKLPFFLSLFPLFLLWFIWVRICSTTIHYSVFLAASMVSCDECWKSINGVSTFGLSSCFSWDAHPHASSSLPSLILIFNSLHFPFCSISLSLN